MISSTKEIIVYGNLYIIIVTVGLQAGTSAILDIPVSWHLISVSAACAFIIYQLERAWFYGPEDLVNQPGRVRWCQRHAPYVTTSLAVAAIVSLNAMFRLKGHTLVWGVGLGLFGLVYISPFGSASSRIKRHVWLKPIAISICWATGGVLLPVAEYGAAASEEVVMLFIYRSMLILANVMLVDLPDREGDSIAHLKTLSMLLPKPRIQGWVITLSLATILIGAFQGVLFSWPPVLYVDLIGAILMILIAATPASSNEKENQYVYRVLPDLVIAWPLITAIVSTRAGF